MNTRNLFILQTGVAVIIAGASLYYKAPVLGGIGGVLILISLILHFAGDKRGEIIAPVSSGVDSTDQEIRSLRAAVENAREASSLFRWSGRESAHLRLAASYRAAATKYGLPGYEMEAATNRGQLSMMIEYIDAFLPLLEYGQIDAARTAARYALEDE